MTPRKLYITSPLINYQISDDLKYWGVHDSNKKVEYLLFLKSKIKDVGLSLYRIYNKSDHRFENLSQEEYPVFINLSNSKQYYPESRQREHSCYN